MRPHRRALVWLILIATSLSTTECRRYQRQPIIGTRVDTILILKSEHKLILRQHGLNLKTYRVALGRGGLSAKRHRGDHRTPDGSYFIVLKREPSRFHRALKISYPNQSDLDTAKNLGVDPGGDIEIHGLPRWLGWLGPVQHLVDWTDRCVAVSNGEIDEIWPLVSVGTPVEIRQ